MKIIILGAGQVGGTLAEYLVNERRDITVVDNNMLLLSKLKDKYDLRVVFGSASYPCILEEAGVEESDLIIAVTNSDEINMLSCQIARFLFNVPKSLARIRSYEYIKFLSRMFQEKNLHINHILSSDKSIIREICYLLDFSIEILQITRFYYDKVIVLVLKLNRKNILVGKTISELFLMIKYINFYIPIIFRKNFFVFPNLFTKLEVDDKVVILLLSKNFKILMECLKITHQSCRKVMIIGGGNIGFGLAQCLEKNCMVKLVELCLKKANELSKKLQNTIVFCGDASDKELLLEEQIDQMDVFISVTGNDEVNIMSAILAKKLGVKKTIVLVKKSEYVDLVNYYDIIDIIISPKSSIISSVMSHVRNMDILNFSLLYNKGIEILETVVHGTAITSSIIGKKIHLMKLPLGVKIVCVIRNNIFVELNNKTILAPEDHLVLLITDHSHILDLEYLFKSNCS